jgi:hypothetical protein
MSEEFDDLGFAAYLNLVDDVIDRMTPESLKEQLTQIMAIVDLEIRTGMHIVTDPDLDTEWAAGDSNPEPAD